MKYKINKEFGLYRFFRPPFNRAAFVAAKAALGVLPKGMRSSKELSVTKKSIPLSDGKKMRIYVIEPRCEGKLPVMLYLHGGGFVFKGAPYHFKLAREYALHAGYVVVFADYRLVCDVSLDVCLDDCESAYRYISDNAAPNWDSSRICLAGDSAGGYLCLALAKRCREKGLQPPSKMMLVYPVVSPNSEFPSMRRYTDSPMWNAKLNGKMWGLCRKYTEPFDPLQTDLSCFPVAYVETAETDCLRDEGKALAHRLCAAGVQCTLNETVGTMHGFDVRPKAPTARAAVARRVAFLRSD